MAFHRPSRGPRIAGTRLSPLHFSRSRTIRTGRLRGRRGVSDVVATIILLALTVTLFASIFAWVSAFPSPPAQNSNSFQASLTKVANGTGQSVSAISILHLSGPSLPGKGGNLLVYFKSARYPSAPEFQNPIPLAWGISNASSWNLGQYWTWNFPTHIQPKLPDNITLYIVSPTQLYFSVILPGLAINVGPTVTQTGTNPAAPAIGASFTVWAVISGTVTAGSVYVNLAGVPGLPATSQTMTLNAQGLWVYTVSGGTTTSGSYFGFITAAGAGQNTTAQVTVTIANSIAPPNTLSVSVVMIPQPPLLPGTAAYFAAVITYTGSLTNEPVTATFWANQTTPNPFHNPSTSLAGTTGVTLSGPGSVTIYSASPLTYSTWILNSTVQITASATVTGVGSQSGTTSFQTPNLVQSIVYTTPSTTFVHSGGAGGCKTTGSPLCPFLNLTVWNNWTGTGAPASLSFSGMVWANASGKQYTYTVAATSVNSGSSVVVDPVGTKVRWVPTVAGTYKITEVLIVTSSGTTVALITDNFVIVVT